MKPTLPTTLLLTLALLAARPGLAQRVLLRADPAADSVPARYGPNRAFYQHLYLGFASVVGRPAGPGADLRYPQSGEFFLGLRNKWRLNTALAAGIDVRYARLQYQLRQNSTKLLPNTATHYREALSLSQVQLEPFGRLNFGRRGNIIGHYLDLSAWGGWALNTTHTYEDRPGANGSARTQVKEQRPDYLRRWSWGLGARLGSGRYAAVARYRLANTFGPTADLTYPELPRWLVGVELGIF